MRRAMIQTYNWVASHAPNRRSVMGPLTLVAALRAAEYHVWEARNALTCAEIDGDYEAYVDLKDAIEFWRERVRELEAMG